MQGIHPIQTGRVGTRPKNSHPIHEADVLARSPTDAAIFVGCGKTTLFKALASGELKFHKLGRKTLIATADLKTWFASLPTRV